MRGTRADAVRLVFGVTIAISLLRTVNDPLIGVVALALILAVSIGVLVPAYKFAGAGIAIGPIAVVGLLWLRNGQLYLGSSMMVVTVIGTGELLRQYRRQSE